MNITTGLIYGDRILHFDKKKKQKRTKWNWNKKPRKQIKRNQTNIQTKDERSYLLLKIHVEEEKPTEINEKIAGKKIVFFTGIFRKVGLTLMVVK